MSAARPVVVPVVMSIMMAAMSASSMTVMRITGISFAADRTRIMLDTGGYAGIMTAGHLMALVVALGVAALGADIHAELITVRFAIALIPAAPPAFCMLSLHVRFAIELIHARTMVGVSAWRFMTAEAAVAPEQAAHTARGMRIGIGAEIRIAAAALRRITDMLHVALTGHMLRFGIAVFAHGLVLMRARLTGIVAFHATGSKFMIFAVAQHMARMTARRRSVIPAVGHAVSGLAARSRSVLLSVAGLVTALAAGSLAVLRAIAAHMSTDAAGSRSMRLPIAGKMAFCTAGSGSMALAIGHAMIFKPAGSLSMGELVAGKMAFCAARAGAMLLAVTIEVAPLTAGSTFMVHAVAVKMARNPTGLWAAMIHAIRFLMSRGLTSGFRSIVRCQRTHRQHRAEHQRCQHQRKNLLQHISPPQRLIPVIRCRKSFSNIIQFVFRHVNKGAFSLVPFRSPAIGIFSYVSTHSLILRSPAPNYSGEHRSPAVIRNESSIRWALIPPQRFGRGYGSPEGCRGLEPAAPSGRNRLRSLSDSCILTLRAWERWAAAQTRLGTLSPDPFFASRRL